MGGFKGQFRGVSREEWKRRREEKEAKKKKNVIKDIQSDLFDSSCGNDRGLSQVTRRSSFERPK